MNPLLAAAADVQAFCAARGWRSCIIGGIAIQRWGEPRLTQDVDVSLLTGFGGEERFIDELLTRYHPRVDGARQLALERRVLLAVTADDVLLDVALAGLPFEERVMSRSTAWDYSRSQRLVTCSAEDLVVLKTFAGRAQDWLDVEGIIVRQGATLDRVLIVEELHPLLELKEDEAPAARLEMLFTKHPA